jgi:hypothetical protein
VGLKIGRFEYLLMGSFLSKVGSLSMTNGPEELKTIEGGFGFGYVRTVGGMWMGTTVVFFL